MAAKAALGREFPTRPALRAVHPPQGGEGLGADQDVGGGPGGGGKASGGTASPGEPATMA